MNRRLVGALGALALSGGLAACGNVDAGDAAVGASAPVTQDEESPGIAPIIRCPKAQGEAQTAHYDAMVDPTVPGARSVEEAISYVIHDRYGDKAPFTADQFTRVSQDEGGALLMSLMDSNGNPIASAIVEASPAGGWIIPEQAYCLNLSTVEATK